MITLLHLIANKTLGLVYENAPCVMLKWPHSTPRRLDPFTAFLTNRTLQ